ncbi:MAG: hypothetical protein OXU66_04610 [Gammaproteobacteria bacterium]|nr:hypothetical protein [Gammaproteobacteria bacterium]MDD9958204.1 hypothetical protein [Gammaproteobacteria bacterium]
MAVKRFYVADMHTALNKIRNQLGADAVILATRQLAAGVEVSAATILTDSANSPTFYTNNFSLISRESESSADAPQINAWPHLSSSLDDETDMPVITSATGIPQTLVSFVRASQEMEQVFDNASAETFVERLVSSPLGRQ